MNYLSERAEAVQVWLEGEWRKTRLKNKGESKRSAKLVNDLKQQEVTGTKLDGELALRELAKAGVIEAAEGLHHGIPVMVRLSEAERNRLESELTDVDDSLELQPNQAVVWRRALNGVLHDWSLGDQRRLAQGLRALAESLPEAYALSAFEASARYLLGSSKLLAGLPRELVRAFAIDTADFRGPAAWVLAAMPLNPEGLLLIENPQSFNQACRVGLNERLALVCSFGYGLSLNEILSVPERVRLIGEGAASHTLTELLELPHKTFWGDLDPEGLRIYLRLRQTIPDLRLSALYEPMIERFECSGGHPLHGLTGKAEQRHAGDWSRGLDQEVLDDSSLAVLAGQALGEATQKRWLEMLADPAEPTTEES